MDVPKKKPNKQQAWDKEGCPRYNEPTEAAKQGKRAAMIELGLEPVEMLPFHDPDFVDDENRCLPDLFSSCCSSPLLATDWLGGTTTAFDTFLLFVSLAPIAQLIQLAGSAYSS